MIVINITDEQGVVLGQTTLVLDDFEQNLSEPGIRTRAWIGEKILNELPSNAVALRKLLDA